MIITYDPENGQVCPDKKAEQFVVDFINSGEQTLTVGSELIIQYFRIQVKQGNIAHGDIVFHYTNDAGTLNEMHLDAGGYVSWYPQGFCDYMEMTYCTLLGWDLPEGDKSPTT